MTDVLARARRMRYVVGSNPKTGGRAALWPLLLPSLDLDAALVIGRIEPDEGAALHRLFRTVVRADSGRIDPDALGGHRVDAIRIGSGTGARRFQGSGMPTSVGHQPPLVYRECRNRDEEVPGSAEGDAVRLIAATAPNQPRLLAPAGEPTVHAFLEHAGWLTSRRGLGPSGLRASLRTLLGRDGSRSRACAVVTGAPGAAAGPPRYVVEVAAEDGIDVAADRWAIVAPGAYATQKVLLFLFRPGSPAPHTIVKLAPEPEHADRLMIEADALRRLAAVDLPQGRVPALRFAGLHAARGVVGEEWIAGRAFRAVAQASSDCPYLEAATSSLTELARATAKRRPATEIAAALRQLLRLFIATYQVPDAERGFLEEQIARIADHGGTLPVVVQHGDPGAWNMLVDDDARVVLLDWESSEQSGVPLWDLVYFLRSYGSMERRRAGTRDRLRVASHHLVGETDLQARFTADIARHAHVVGLPPALIEPLFYACWMHRALKEATRLAPGRLESGHYRRLLRRLIDRRDAPALRRLLAGGAA
jgi:aminoglycoside phosphotransferase (APT) family kinase protein